MSVPGWQGLFTLLIIGSWQKSCHQYLLRERMKEGRKIQNCLNFVKIFTFMEHYKGVYPVVVVGLEMTYFLLHKLMCFYTCLVL